MIPASSAYHLKNFMIHQRQFKQSSRAAFSLVEVVLAIGVFALTIVAVIGLLGPIASQVRDLRDSKTANNLPSAIREELNRLGFESFVNANFTAIASDHTAIQTSDIPTGRTILASLVATQDGSEVAEASQTTRIPQDERYFLIQVMAPPAPTGDAADLRYQSGDAHVAFEVEISWPFRLGDGSLVAYENRQRFSYYTAIVVGAPF